MLLCFHRAGCSQSISEPRLTLFFPIYVRKMGSLVPYSCMAGGVEKGNCAASATEGPNPNPKPPPESESLCFFPTVGVAAVFAFSIEMTAPLERLWSCCAACEVR